jgi:sporulation protein YlmC with PRC-barrel domain
MKRELFVFAILLVLCTMPVFAGITGDTITGKATSQPTNLSVYVSGTPTLVIRSPLNQTYSSGLGLLLNYSESGAYNVWYNFDNNPNTTINGAIYFNISDGSHTLYMYANSSGNITSRSVTFSVGAVVLPAVEAAGGAAVGPPGYDFEIECEKLVSVTGNETIGIECLKCKPPYLFDAEQGCCLDRNNNSRCDADELELEAPLAPAENIFAKIFPIILLILMIAAIIWFIFRRLLPEKRFLSALRKKKVYSSNGDYLGEVEEVYVKENRIDCVAIKLTKDLGAKKILLKWGNVASAGDVLMINKNASEHIAGFENKE